MRGKRCQLSFASLERLSSTGHSDPLALHSDFRWARRWFWSAHTSMACVNFPNERSKPRVFGYPIVPEWTISSGRASSIIGQPWLVQLLLSIWVSPYSPSIVNMSRSMVSMPGNELFTLTVLTMNVLHFCVKWLKLIPGRLAIQWKHFASWKDSHAIPNCDRHFCFLMKKPNERTISYARSYI